MREAQLVKRRHLSKTARTFAPLWDGPVKWATVVAGRRVSRQAAKQSGPA